MSFRSCVQMVPLVYRVKSNSSLPLAHPRALTIPLRESIFFNWPIKRRTSFAREEEGPLPCQSCSLWWQWPCVCVGGVGDCGCVPDRSRCKQKTEWKMRAGFAIMSPFLLIRKWRPREVKSHGGLWQVQEQNYGLSFITCSAVLFCHPQMQDHKAQ